MKRTTKGLIKWSMPRLMDKVKFWPIALLWGSLLVGCSSATQENSDTAGNDNIETHLEESSSNDGKGIGPVTNVVLGPEIDQALAEKGKVLFEGKCAACHQLSEQKIIGPGLARVTDIRKPEWLMNMVINPEEMTKKDPIAKKLLAEHKTQMMNQNVNEQDARAILEFLRYNDRAW